MRFFLSVLSAVISLGSLASAQTELTESDVRSILGAYPVGCQSPARGDRCTAITSTMLLTPNRGVEQSLFAIEVQDGRYVAMTVSSNFTLGSDGICYPNVASDLRGAQMFLTASLEHGIEGALPLPAQGREFVTSMLIDPLANLLGEGRFCSRYYIPQDRKRSDIYLVRSFLDGEAFDAPAPVQLMPRAAIAGLGLVPME